MNRITIKDEIEHLKSVIEMYRNSSVIGKDLRCAKATLLRLENIEKARARTTALRLALYRGVTAARKKRS